MSSRLDQMHALLDAHAADISSIVTGNVELHFQGNGRVRIAVTQRFPPQQNRPQETVVTGPQEVTS